MSGAEFIGIPNNVVIMSMYLAGLFCSVILMRAVYISSERIKQYHTYELTLAVNGVKWYSTMVAANFLLDFLLLARVPYGFVNGETASVDAVTRNWWCVLRLFFSFLIALLAYIYDAHVSFRWFSVLVLPLQVAVESVSEVANVSAWHCLEQGICVPDAFLHRLYYWMVWRDLVGVTLKLLCMVFAYWLFFIHGYAKNEIYNPRREHRDMSIKLDGMKLQAKKIIRKKLDSSTS